MINNISHFPPKSKCVKIPVVVCGSTDDIGGTNCLNSIGVIDHLGVAFCIAGDKPCPDKKSGYIIHE